MQFSRLPDAPQRKPFLGTGWAFPPAFSVVEAGAAIVSDEEDIWQSLRILFNTSLGERVLQAEYGCNLRDFLFAPINVSLLSYLEELMKRAIGLHEPRIKLEQLVIEPDAGEGLIRIGLTYIVRNTNTRHNRVYPYYYQEGTNLNL